MPLVIMLITFTLDACTHFCHVACVLLSAGIVCVAQLSACSWRLLSSFAASTFVLGDCSRNAIFDVSARKATELRAWARRTSSVTSRRQREMLP